MAVTYEPIATTTLGASQNSITFSSIPNTYTDLKLILVATDAASNAGATFTFNNDTASNYSYIRLEGNGTTTASSANTNMSNFIMSPTYTVGTTPSFHVLDVFNYAGSTFKTCLWSLSNDLNGSGNTTLGVGMWRSTTAINEIDIAKNSGIGTFTAGTTATLYGITKA